MVTASGLSGACLADDGVFPLPFLSFLPAPFNAPVAGA